MIEKGISFVKCDPPCALKVGTVSPSLYKIKAKSKVNLIVRHWLQQGSPLRAGQPKLRNTSTYDLSDVVLAFINSDEEVANERPNATRSGLSSAITRRSKIDFYLSQTTIAKLKRLNLFKNLSQFSMSTMGVKS